MSAVGRASDAPSLPGAAVILRRRRRPSPSLAVLLVLLGALVFVAVFAGLLAPYGATTGNLADSVLGLNERGHLLGTDVQGRDVLSRLLYGSRLSLLTGVVPVLVSGGVGTALGLAAGLGGRALNAAIMRTLDVFFAFPDILLAIAIGAVLGPSIRNVIIAISVVLIPGVARVVEAEVLSIRSADYMRAARCSGASEASIALRQVLPNVAPPIVVYCTGLVGLSIIEASGLSFLGLGAAPPTAEWGLMLTGSQDYILTNGTVAIIPALVILLVALLFNALGNRLRVDLDVRRRGAAQ